MDDDFDLLVQCMWVFRFGQLRAQAQLHIRRAVCIRRLVANRLTESGKHLAVVGGRVFALCSKIQEIIAFRHKSAIDEGYS